MTEREDSGRQRNKSVYFMVTADEKALIDKAVKVSGARSIREYLTSMALGGYVVHVDMEPIGQSLALLRNISGNVNQIARRANETRNIYAEDLEDLCDGYDKIKLSLCEAISTLKKVALKLL